MFFFFGRAREREGPPARTQLTTNPARNRSNESGLRKHHRQDSLRVRTGTVSISERVASAPIGGSRSERGGGRGIAEEGDGGDEVGDLTPGLSRKPDRQLSLPGYADEDFKRKQYQARKGKRNSIVEYIESVRRLQEVQIDFIIQKRTGTIGAGMQNVKFLPRGGTYVSTAVGPVQFGLPPETIKDSMQMGLSLPTHFVLPKERFNLQTGINVAEFEFPAYFNFFVLRKRVNLVVTREVEPLIRTIFQETLLGPRKVELPTEFSEAVPREAYPDLMKESSKFRKNPFNPEEDLSVDTVLEFTYFDDDGVATLGGGADGAPVVRIHDEGENYRVEEDGRDVATVSSYVILSPPPLEAQPKRWRRKVPRASPSGMEIREAYTRGGGAEEVADPSGGNESEGEWEWQDLAEGDDENAICFVPPTFGITMLGNSHGFDFNGTTTGFVLWMNRRGIMVDPPPHSGAILKQHGIPSRLIHGIVLTHCHADHDAGTFQKILEEGKVVLYTTRVIKDSFMRKYSAISGLDEGFLGKLFEFREVVVGERINVYGGKLQFHCALHSIPCVGFAAYCCGKSMVYSGDTLNDREGIEKFVELGLMTPERRDSLVNFPWHHTVILHEAGVPPIHTPIKTLVDLPEDVKRRLYVVHVAAKDIPDGCGLRTAEVGPENTIVISNRRGPDMFAMEMLDLITKIDLFQDFPVDRAVEIVQCGRWVRYDEGATLIEQGTLGDKLYVIAMGVVSVRVDGELVKTLTVGDHFGEMSIVTRLPRTATIATLTEAELIEFTGHEFMHLVRNTSAIDRLRHLGLMQREQSWQVICSNSVLGRLSSTQKTYLQSILRKHDSERGEVLWESGQQAKIAVLVEEGKFVFARAKHTSPFERGAFVGEMQALLYGTPLKTTLVCGQGGSFYYVYKRDLLKFFDDNPGVLVFFQDRRFVE